MRPKPMKKVFAILAAAVLTCGSAKAQEDASLRFGIKLSPNLGWLRPDTKGIESNGTPLGYSFGLLAEFPIGDRGNYAFASGLFLTNLGGGYTEEYTFVENVGSSPQVKDLQTDVHLRYVDLPLTIKMMTNEIGYMRYYGQLGISAGFNIRAKADKEIPVVAGTLTDDTPIVSGFKLNEDEDFQDKTNLFRAGLVIGGGMEYNFSGNTALLFGITYNNGFTNILKDVTYNGSNAKVFNDYLELTLGIFF
jgi:hypothetical protein